MTAYRAANVSPAASSLVFEMLCCIKEHSLLAASSALVQLIYSLQMPVDEDCVLAAICCAHVRHIVSLLEWCSNTQRLSGVLQVL